MCIGGISCLLNVTDIGQCNLKKPSKCYLAHVVGVTCRLGPVKIPDVPVHLMIPGKDVQNLRDGVVEVFINDHWGFVLGIGQFEVNALCKTLGLEYGGVPIYGKYLPGPGPAWIDCIDCPLLADDLQDCDFDWSNEEIKVAFEVRPAVVKCRTEPVEDYEVHLFGGNSANEGELLVKYDNTWTTVYSYSFQTTNVAVVCKQLGFSNGTALNLPFDSREIPTKTNNIQQVYCPRGASHLGDCFYGCLGSKDYRLSSWAPGDCNEAVVHRKYRGGVQCSI
ncbi:unnamed protein product [Mytilus coruscus]|uniref:SRCR domain-containing protein n=1 Tax=Mytilus coruscus TaxID=42192 RepID=A0A6J8BBG4_MYTCO|nr:unnamed protein product [Mytilus coruscus]